MTNKYIRRKWLKFIPSGFCYIKNKNIGSFTNGKHIGREIINWNKLWFYLQYQLNVLKNIVDVFSNTLFVTDYSNIGFFVKIIALKTKNFFMVGPWKGGYLTSIKWYKFLPNFIFNFGMVFKKTFYNEILLLGIPTISFTDITLSNSRFLAINYIIPFQNMDSMLLRHICLLFTFILKKFNNFYIFSLNEKKENIFIFSDKIKNIFNKILYLKKKTQNYLAYNPLFFSFLKNVNKFNNLSALLYSFINNLSLFLTYRKYISPFYFKYKFINNKLFFLNKIFLKNDKQLFLNKNLSFNFINKKLYVQKVNFWLKNECLFSNLS